jgi:G3E family GTPase
MSSEIPDFTPVNLLTGFLGAGKTTLLQRLLAAPQLADTAVLINEFGEVGLDRPAAWYERADVQVRQALGRDTTRRAHAREKLIR